MALPSGFQERIQQMEETRNQRISILQAEKDFQRRKFQVLAAKRINLRNIEQRCLMLQQKNAGLEFKILATITDVEILDSKYQGFQKQLRDMKEKINEVENSEKDKERFYEMQRSEMEKFKEDVGKHVLESCKEVQEMRNRVCILKSKLQELQNTDGSLSDPRMIEEERKKSQFLEQKETLDKTLASNYQLKALLQNQLQEILRSQLEERD